MKMRTFIAITFLSIIGMTSVSCNSCDDRKTDPVPNQTPEVSNSSTDNVTQSVDDNTFDVGNSSNTDIPIDVNNSTISDNEGRSAGSPSTRSTAVNKARDRNGNKNPVRDLEGYSAPNGTDAENHDGDPYTKHDTTSMPTGTSIR